MIGDDGLRQRMVIPSMLCVIKEVAGYSFLKIVNILTLTGK